MSGTAAGIEPATTRLEGDNPNHSALTDKMLARIDVLYQLSYAVP